MDLMEGGAVKPKESGLASDLKQPEEVAGAPQGGVAEPNAVAQNPAQAGDKAAEDGAPKLAVPAAYKEDDPIAPGGEAHKQSELGARGVPLGKKRPDDRQPLPQNDQVAQLKGEERSLDKEQEKMENLKKELIEKEVQARLEIEREIKEKVVREQELEKEREKERIEKEVQARLEKERLERERKEQLAKEQELVNNRIEKEVQARVEKERLDRERREKLAREQELEKERAVAEKLTQDKAAKERLQLEIQKADNEILEKAMKEKRADEARERLAQLERVIEARNAGKAAQGAEREDGEALKKGGRDLKEKVAAQADPREDVEDGAVKAEAHPQGSHEKAREQGAMDLRRRRRAVGPRETGGPPEKTKASGGVPGLEPLLELGGSDLHVALEERLLAGAMVHSRQIKQVSEDERAK